jgi:hypothetical protein
VNPLSSDFRRLLEKKVVEARDAAETASVGALKALAVDRSEPFASMSEEDRRLRRALRARARQLGDFQEPLAESAGFDLLVQEVAYEQWHRMLFARFLAENNLLIHPKHGVPVTLQECAELAPDDGEPDEWMVAARYASEMLPGIFREGDPTHKVRLAPEGRQALEAVLRGLPPEVFIADDSLGWVYQFWQSKKKKEVNASERKIGGADLAPVTQLFTEHYMVAFLLENSLGAWWAGKHPDSPLLKEWEYLRYTDDGTPAAGTFEGWPSTAAEVTVMDPCCGSGHFLVTAFDMLRKMREEEEGLSAKEAADVVLRDNLFGLELDGRCVQIAVFALALEAWKVGGYRELPLMNVACSGVPARGTAREWRAYAQGDATLAETLDRLFHLFKDADTLGSLIDPRRAAETNTLLGVDYERVAPLLHDVLKRFGGDDPARQVFSQAAEDVATAAGLLAGRYTLVATNYPFMQSGKQAPLLRDFCRAQYPLSSSDLATAFVERSLELLSGGSLAWVAPDKWRYLVSYAEMRRKLLGSRVLAMLASLGFSSFRTPMFDLGIGLQVVHSWLPPSDSSVAGIVVSDADTPSAKSKRLKSADLVQALQQDQMSAPDARITLEAGCFASLLAEYADSYWGLGSGDYPRYGRVFWELPMISSEWIRQLSTVSRSIPYGGREHLLLWESGTGALSREPSAFIRGVGVWGSVGMLVSQTGSLPVTLYTGECWDTNSSPIIPKDKKWISAIWAFCTSPEFSTSVRRIDQSVKVTNATLLKVPFDLEHWSKVAQEKYPNGLPEPHSDDPTQWLFKGNIVDSESPLHVAVTRLLGYSWPDQEPEELDRFADDDGIVCLPPVSGERPAADRLLELLAAAYGDAWSHSSLEGLLVPEGAPNLETWLRDKFFASHCKLFHHRPFIWHIWDGRKDGFSALVNYHKLDRKLLERLTYTTLQSWIDRQGAEAKRGGAGAEARLIAATGLKEKLELILEGEPPYDIYVRWKPLSKQPIGWDPDLNDGVRLNCRPFVTAGVFRAKFNVKWNKDRGKNPDGSERLNDLHYTIAEKRAARAKEKAD